MKEHKPTDELIKRASAIADPAQRRLIVGDILKLRDGYARTDAEFKAPDGQPSGLIAALGTEMGQQAWYAVRTPAFKDWFGDWERAARIAAIESLGIKEIEAGDPKSKKETESALRSFKPIKNESDGRIAVIPVNTVGKIINHKGYDISKIIEDIPFLYRTSLLGWSEPETRREGHKAHPNVKGHHNYINKFADGTGEYFIRFALSEEKAKPTKTGENKIHSTAISDIEIYKKGDRSQRIRDYLPGRSEPTAFYGKRLAEFFNSVNPNSISQIVDGHGEPKPVYRGDRPGRERFANPQGTFFTGERALAEGYSSGGLYELFLCMKNPLVLNEENFIEARERINDMLADIYEKDRSELEHDSRYQALRKNYLAFRNGQGSSVRDFYSDFLPEVSEDTGLEGFKETLLKSVHDANAFEWRQIDYHDIDILNPFVQCLGYDGIVRPYDPIGQARGTEYVAFDPRQIKSASANTGTYGRDDPSFTDRGINFLAKEKTMPDENENVWTKDSEANFHSEELKHAFGDSKIKFGIFQRGLNKTDDPLLIAIHDGFKSAPGDDVLTVRFGGSVAAAKKMIDDSIKHFGQKQGVNVYLIKDYFNSYASQHELSDIQSNWNESNPNTPMRFGNLPYEIGSTDHRKEQLEQLEKDSPRAAVRHGALKDTEFNGLTAAEPAKMQAQAQSPSLVGRNNDSKEKPMSDLSEEPAEEKNLSPRELAFQNAVWQRSVIAAALKNGTLSCLPGKDGLADTEPAVNIANHTHYHGDTLLYLKEHQKKNGYPTAEYATQAQIEKAREEAPGAFVRKGEKGVSIHVSEKNEETGKWDEKHIRLFNVAQLQSPKAFKKWAEDKKLEYLQSQYGTKFQPAEPGQKAQGPEIVCSSPKPSEYLGQYFAAVSTGRPFKASQETAKEFAKNMGDSLFEKIGKSPKTGEPVTDPFKLSKICREAGQYCKEFMKELGAEARRQGQEQKQEQRQPRKGQRR